MLKKIYGLIGVLMGCFTGAFIGGAAFRFADYKKHPGLYAMQSAPWYTGIQITGIALVVLLLLCVAVRALIRNKLKRQSRV
ncbi:hypothetical protein [Neobittarella massiliensis]|uniref:Uncharacterized protein n=1 Tax=uncultured Anaerotruncus sp. TaxID=905011 RepID=A0A1C6FWP7_9FIRM|nr:hypothetical protein [Neobittarella massiliensis]SCJ37476.1 Uncharacterised protein [uncultured Anaerotruncus sp.]